MSGFPLAQAGEGERVDIIGIDGGQGSHRKLADLGLVLGQSIEVVSRQPGGPMLVAVGESRIALGFGLALKLTVLPSAQQRSGM